MYKHYYMKQYNCVFCAFPLLSVCLTSFAQILTTNENWILFLAFLKIMWTIFGCKWHFPSRDTTYDIEHDKKECQERRNWSRRIKVSQEDGQNWSCGSISVFVCIFWTNDLICIIVKTWENISSLLSHLETMAGFAGCIKLDGVELETGKGGAVQGGGQVFSTGLGLLSTSCVWRWACLGWPSTLRIWTIPPVDHQVVPRVDVREEAGVLESQGDLLGEGEELFGQRVSGLCLLQAASLPRGAAVPRLLGLRHAAIGACSPNSVDHDVCLIWYSKKSFVGSTKYKIIDFTLACQRNSTLKYDDKSREISAAKRYRTFSQTWYM